MAETADALAPTVTEKEEPLPPAPLLSPTADLPEPEPEPEPEPKPEPKSEPEPQPEPVAVVTTEVTESEKPKPIEPRKVPESLISFKEESNKISDLSDSERKALDEFRVLLQEALKNNEFTHPKTQPQQTPTTSDTQETKTPVTVSEIVKEPKSEESACSADQEVSIWGIPLLKDERTDVILLKFLRARDFKVKEAFTMIQNTITWRKEFNIDGLIEEDLGDELDKVVFMHGFDKDGHPVCYNVYGEFQNKELYRKTFGDEEKRMRFLRWRIQFLEKSIRNLDFRAGGVSTIFQVSDLKNSPGPGKRELRIATKQALLLLQDNYPELVAKQVFINVPWWYLAFYTMISPFLTQRTKSKFVFAGPAKTSETLFKYIPPEQVPIQYGGLSVDFCDCNPEFSMDDPATELTVKPATKQTVEIQVNEKCIIVWELRVVGWEVSYTAEYVPNAEGAYIVVIHKAKKKVPTDEPVVCNSFKISELGKIVLTIDNPTAKRKKLVYRFKVKPFM